MRFSMLLASVLLTACFKTDAGTNVTGGCPPAEACSTTPVAVTGGHTFVSLAAGRYHTCGLTSTGELWCWGYNSVGQLGAGSTVTTSGVPLKVSGSLSFTAVSGGQFHTCALATDSGAYCWGDNTTMVLGASTTDVCGTNPCTRTPLRAGGTATFSAIAAGAAHTCALDASGNPLCWGYNVLGELGNNSYGTATATPQPIGGGKTFAKLSAGYRFNCALDSAGVLHCWGYGDEGELGTLGVSNCTPQSGGTYLCSIVPVAAGTTEKFSQVVTGAAFGCGLTTASAIFCWGYGGEGQLGTGNLFPSGTPVAISVAGPWSALAAGYFHACALKTNGAAYCWGFNNYAQLGDGSKVYAQSTPQPVGGGKTFTQIVAGSNHTCGLMADGTAWCWGGDAVRQLGRG